MKLFDLLTHSECHIPATLNVTVNGRTFTTDNLADVKAFRYWADLEVADMIMKPNHVDIYVRD